MKKYNIHKTNQFDEDFDELDNSIQVKIEDIIEKLEKKPLYW